MRIRHEHLDAEVIERLPRREPLRLLNAKACPKETIIPLDVRTIAIDELVVRVQDHQQVTTAMVVHRRLVVAADEAWATSTLRCRQPRRKGGLRVPPGRSTAATIQGDAVPPISHRPIDRRPYLQEPTVLTRERVALQECVRDITRGDNPVTDLAGARNVPTGTKG